MTFQPFHGTITGTAPRKEEEVLVKQDCLPSARSSLEIIRWSRTDLPCSMSLMTACRLLIFYRERERELITDALTMPGNKDKQFMRVFKHAINCDIVSNPVRCTFYVI